MSHQHQCLIQAATYPEFKKELASLYEQHFGTVAGAVEISATPAAPAAAPEVAAPTPKRGRPGKKTADAAAPTPPAAEVVAPVAISSTAPATLPAAADAAAPMPTLDEVRAKLQLLNDTKGVSMVRDVYRRFGCEKFSEIGQDKWPALIAKIEAVLGGASV